MSKKGGYTIIDLKNHDWDTSVFKINGIFETIKGSYTKTILLSGLVIDGKHVKDVYSVVSDDVTHLTISAYGKNFEIYEDDNVKMVTGSSELYTHTIYFGMPDEDETFVDCFCLNILLPIEKPLTDSVEDWNMLAHNIKDNKFILLSKYDSMASVITPNGKTLDAPFNVSFVTSVYNENGGRLWFLSLLTDGFSGDQFENGVSHKMANGINYGGDYVIVYDEITK